MMKNIFNKILTGLVFIFIASNQNYCQQAFDFHTHEGFELVNSKIQFNDYNFIIEHGIKAFCYALPVNRTETQDLYSRLETEISQIGNIAKENPNLIIPNTKVTADQFDVSTVGCVFSIEYFNGIFDDDLSNISRFKELGICYITLVDNEYDNLFCEDRLTKFGKDVIKSMNEYNLLIDISHLTEKQRIEVIRLSSKPVIYSHSNSRAIASHDYNISLTELNLLKANGGFVFISFNEMGLFEERNENNNGLSRLAQHILYFTETLGIDKVGIGSDYQTDGKYVPNNLASMRALLNLGGKLKEVGFSKNDIKKIFYKNAVTLLEVST